MCGCVCMCVGVWCVCVKRCVSVCESGMCEITRNCEQHAPLLTVDMRTSLLKNTWLIEKNEEKNSRKVPARLAGLCDVTTCVACEEKCPVSLYIFPTWPCNAPLTYLLWLEWNLFGHEWVSFGVVVHTTESAVLCGNDEYKHSFALPKDHTRKP